MITNLAGINDRGCLSAVPTADEEGLVPETLEVSPGVFRVIWAPRPYRLIFGLGGDAANVTAGKHTTLRAPDSFTITEVRASLYTESSSGDVEFDLLLNGVSVFSTTLTIDEGEKSSVDATVPAVLGTTTVVDDDELSAEVLSAGSGAKGAVVIIKGTFP